MSEAFWLALSVCVVGTVLLCSGPVVRALSKQSPPREPPSVPAGLCVGRVSLPLEGYVPAPGFESATGRLVRMKRSPSGDYVFTLRHMWTSADLGLLSGYPLDGVLRVTAGVAHSSVFVPFGAVALLVGFCAAGGLGMLAVFTADPSGWNLVCLSFWVWTSYVLWRNAKRAVGPVSQDAVALLRASRQALPT